MLLKASIAIAISILVVVSAAVTTSGPRWSTLCSSSSSSSSSDHCSNISGLACTSNNTCYTSTPTGVFRFHTTGGSKAEKIRTPTTAPVDRLAFASGADSPIGVATSGSTVLYLASTTELRKSTITGNPLNGTPTDVRTSRDGKVQLVSGNETVLYSTDGGKTFASVALSSSEFFDYTIVSVSVATPTTWYVVGTLGNSISRVMATFDGGNRFFSVFDSQSFLATGIDCDGDRCMLVGNNLTHSIAFRSTNAGRSWDVVYTIAYNFPSSDLFNFASARIAGRTGTVWISGSFINGGFEEAFSLSMTVSRDGGKTWSASDNGISDSATTPIAMTFTDDGSVVVVSRFETMSGQQGTEIYRFHSG